MMTETPVIAFFSTRPGVGRTMALCNAALVLAGAGKRVLILEEDPGAPALRRYLSRFLPDRRREPLTAGPDDWTAREVPIDSPGHHVHHAVLRPGALPSDAIRATRYDYVLVNAGTTAVATPVLRSCGQAVLCFQLSPHAIDEAAAAAREIEATGTRVVPVPTRVDLAGGEALSTARQRARGSFSRGPEVEIPYVTDYYFSDALAAMAEPPGGGTGQRAAYERLVEVLSGGTVTTLESVTVVHAPGYDLWAEWIGAQAERWGVRVETPALDAYLERTPVDLRAGDHHAAVLFVGPSTGPTGLEPPVGRAVRGPSLPGRGLLRVWVDDEPLESLRPTGGEIDLRGSDEADAIGELQARLGVSGSFVPGGDGAGAIRFPGRKGLVRLPPREPGFVGRQALLSALREPLSPRWERPGRCLVHGLEGRGKSALVTEFCHRFRGAYDTVHWVHAESAFTAREGLRELAETLGLPAREDAVATLLDHLATSDSGRWLIVFDDADDPAGLDGLIPAGPYGHVIVTSRSAAWDLADRVEVAALNPAEAIDLLTRADDRISREGAGRIATTVEHLPLALTMAKAWLDRELNHPKRARRTIEERRSATVERFLFSFGHVQRGLEFGERPTGVHAVMVEMLLDLLPGHPGSTGAQWLMESLTFVSADGVPLTITRSSLSRGYAAGLIREYGDEFVVDVLLRLVHEHALAQLEPGPKGRVRVHRLIAGLISARMTGDARADRRAQALQLLAWHAPAETEGPGAALYAELGKHLFSSGALDSLDPMVQRWITNQVRYLFLLGERGSWAKAVTIGEQALANWEAAGAAVEPELVNGLRVQLSIVYRALGRLADGFTLSQRALQELTTTRRSHPLRFIAAGAHAADLRATGDFDESYHWDSVAWEGMTRLFGPDHDWTSRSLNNLAVSASLNGKPHAAIDLAMRRMDGRLKLYGEADLGVWRTALTAGVLLRDLGRFHEAYELLRTGLEQLAGHNAKGGRRSLLELRMETSLAAAERMLGRPFEALARDRETLEELRSLVGSDSLYTLLCRAGIAADLHARNEHGEAASHGAHVAEHLARMQETHPFTHAARVNLACYTRAAGDQEGARELAGAAHDALRTRLGLRHPYTLAAAATLANQIVETDPGQALELEMRAHDYLVRIFGPEHPRVRAVRENLHDTRRRQVRPGATDGRRHDFEIEILGN
ncbi:FxSxx-COOH system tetratricopeptide repeat protein [Nonomuraea sp. NBC_01738]|uniref:FxSxx-COOH system tetratricopeptide repeat protein n=1 Tax=Nonomuraea sp. NBC_01738 TaxID=2976003 RepID=UPI002E0D8B62|nr:FxSxx-COOH system tetratricopeptide repeat protein [Nonomuraea sp. NBC_01738]